MSSNKDPLPTTTPLSIKERVRLAKTKDRATWDATVDDIVRARGGHYPTDWRTYAPALGYGSLVEWPGDTVQCFVDAPAPRRPSPEAIRDRVEAMRAEAEFLNEHFPGEHAAMDADIELMGTTSRAALRSGLLARADCLERQVNSVALVPSVA